MRREQWDQLWVFGVGTHVPLGDLPMIEKYEGSAPGGEQLAALGVLPEGWMDTEFNEILAHGWDTFLRTNNDPALNRLASVEHTQIFPAPSSSLPDRYGEVVDYENRYRDVVAMAAAGLPPVEQLPGFTEGLAALEALRKSLFEDWLQDLGLDGIVFPAYADVGAQDADITKDSADRAGDNRVFFSNGNYALRHFGIPSITVAMGIMEDTGMPVGLTIAGPAYKDKELLSYGYAFEAAGSLRTSPRLAPRLITDHLPGCAVDNEGEASIPEISVEAHVGTSGLSEGARLIELSGMVHAPDDSRIVLSINVDMIPVIREEAGWKATVVLPPEGEPGSIGSNPVAGSLAVIHVLTPARLAAGAFTEIASKETNRR